MPNGIPCIPTPDRDWYTQLERLRRLVASGEGATVGAASPLTAAEAERLRGRLARGRVQEIVRRVLAQHFSPTKPPTHNDNGRQR